MFFGVFSATLCVLLLHGTTRCSTQRLLSIACTERASISYLNFSYWLAYQLGLSRYKDFDKNYDVRTSLTQIFDLSENTSIATRMYTNLVLKSRPAFWTLENVRPKKRFFLQKKPSMRKHLSIKITNSYVVPVCSSSLLAALLSVLYSSAEKNSNTSESSSKPIQSSCSTSLASAAASSCCRV